MPSGLRGMGEAVKAINENLLRGERLRARTRAHVMRERARVRAFIGEGDGKVGRKEKESGGGSEEGGVIVGRKDCRWKYEGGEDGRESEGRNEKAFTLCKKRSVAIIKVEIS